ncbi:MAG: hypothetical protein FWD14_00530, partial [Treponema sp.]|nr:hypothetical protein [Treponema sp.]
NTQHATRNTQHATRNTQHYYAYYVKQCQLHKAKFFYIFNLSEINKILTLTNTLYIVPLGVMQRYEKAAAGTIKIKRR